MSSGRKSTTQHFNGEVNWEDVPRGLLHAYERGFQSGMNTARAFVSAKSREEARSQLAAALKLFPELSRKTSFYFGMRGVHDGLYGLRLGAVEVILNATFQGSP